MTHRSTEHRGKSHVVVSIFPGADLLGRGFEQAGFCVLRGPDIQWGQDVRGWHLVSHICAGIIGGPPCQGFSKKRRGGRVGDALWTYCVEMLHQFRRLVTEGKPEWFLLENVPTVPDVVIDGYTVQRFNLNANECGVAQNRWRTFQFGFRSGNPLVIARALPTAGRSQPCCLASEGRRPRRSWSEFCALQGLPDGFDLPGLPRQTKYLLVGNGVTVPMARTIAQAILDRNKRGRVRLCICQCGREVTGKAVLATAACRKRMQRKRARGATVRSVTGNCDSAGVTGPGPVTGAQSQEAA